MKRFSLILFLLITILSCKSDKSGRLNSTSITSPEKRIKVLSEYFNLRGNTLDAEFDIIDTNIEGSRMLPGATYRGYKVALKLDRASYKLWISDIEQTSETISYDWVYELTKKNKNFLTSSKAAIYRDQNKLLIAFNNECIVFIHIIQN